MMDSVEELLNSVPCGTSTGHGESCHKGRECNQCSELIKAANEITSLRQQLTKPADERLSALFGSLCEWKAGKISGDELANKQFGIFAANDALKPADTISVSKGEWEAMKSKIIKCLDGIDKDECENSIGWWETSKGAEFGASKLKEVLDIIDAAIQGASNG
jgi:hypothetical protein